MMKLISEEFGHASFEPNPDTVCQYLNIQKRAIQLVLAYPLPSHVGILFMLFLEGRVTCTSKHGS